MKLPDDLQEELEELMPEEKEEILRQIENLSSYKELKKAIRDYKLRLDLPDLTEEEIQPVPDEEFDKVEEYVLLVETVSGEIDLIDFTIIHPHAKDYLLGEIKKTIGHLARFVETNGK